MSDPNVERTREHIAENLETVRIRIAEAATRAGRLPSDVTLVAVSKMHPFAVVRAAYEAGQRDFGENRIEELAPKAYEGRVAGLGGLRWHLIGPVQSRKTTQVVGPLALLHAIDRTKIAQRIGEAARSKGVVMDALFEVNISGEASKHGFAPDELLATAGELLRLPGLRVHGLMTMAPFVENPEETRPVFRGLRELRDRLADKYPQCEWSQLSMGMTNDFQVAIEEGATLVRNRFRHLRRTPGLTFALYTIGAYSSAGVKQMLENSRIAFIGSGAMGEAMIHGLIDKGLVQPPQIVASDPVPARRDQIKSQFGVTPTADNLAAVRGAGIVVLSIKPQVVSAVLGQLRGELDANAVVISIIAGVPIAVLGGGLQHESIVRCMPNTPAQVGMGMTVWTATEATTEVQRAQAAAVIGALGEQIAVHEEGYLDMATGLSGSGPGFVFLLLEALIDAGVQIGFSRADADKMVLQTVGGSVELMRRTGLHPAELRNRVTSPGGTTAAGLYELEAAGVRATLIRAVDAAYRRSKELGAIYATPSHEDGAAKKT